MFVGGLSLTSILMHRNLDDLYCQSKKTFIKEIPDEISHQLLQDEKFSSENLLVNSKYLILRELFSLIYFNYFWFHIV